jgi:hypothetical protein
MHGAAASLAAMRLRICSKSAANITVELVAKNTLAATKLYTELDSSPSEPASVVENFEQRRGVE